MPITETSVEEQALAALNRGEHHAAHLLLAAEFDKNPKRDDLCRIANLIAPLMMITEAKDALQRVRFEHLASTH